MKFSKIVIIFLFVSCGGDGKIIGHEDITLDLAGNGAKRIRIDTEKNIPGKVSWIIRQKSSLGANECKLSSETVDSEESIFLENENDPLCSFFEIGPISRASELVISSTSENIEYCLLIEMTNQKICGSI